MSVPTFTRSQLEAANGLPRLCTERTLAACIGLSLHQLQRLRTQGLSPSYTTQENGTTVYERRHVVSWMYQHTRPASTTTSSKDVTPCQ